MDRRHLEYFPAVAEQGSFSRAATALSIAQPSLSHASEPLERDLGSRLFARDRRGSRLAAVRNGGAELGLLDAAGSTAGAS